MNNKFEVLAKLIVPAFFLIVWALNQILSKETPATPARGNRPVGPPGGRTPQQKPRPKQTEEDRAFATTDPKSSSSAWGSQTGARGNQSIVTVGDDEVVILGTETVRRPPPARPRTQSSRGNRSKSERRSSTNPADTDKQAQRLGGNISQTVRQTLSSTSVDMKSISQSQPLTSLAVDVRGISGASSMVSSTASAAGSAGPAAEVFDLHGALHSRARIREAFLLNELLQAPVSLRGRESMSRTGPPRR
jgi:hypothetical protein